MDRSSYFFFSLMSCFLFIFILVHIDRKIDTNIKFKVGEIHAEVDVFFSLFFFP